MTTAKITVSVEQDTVRQLAQLVAQGVVPGRSKAIQLTIQEHLAWVLAELRRLAAVLVVQVVAERGPRIQRILHRDASIHISVSDDEVERVNALASQVDLRWTARVDNRRRLDPEAITEAVRQLLRDPAAARAQS